MYFNIFKIYKRENVSLSIVTIIITALLTELCIGGRFFLYYVGFGLLFIFFSQKSNLGAKKGKRSVWLRVATIFGLVALLMAFVTLTGEGKVFSTIYSYFCGCIKLLDVKLQEFFRTENYTFGVTSFHGFVRPIFTILRSLGVISNLPEVIQNSENYLIAVEEVTNEVSRSGGTFNGFVSLFYAFYVDLGFPGIIVGSFLWGFFCERIYLKMKHKGSDKDFLVYLLILQALSMSMTRFAFCTYQYALAFVYMYIIFEMGKKKRVINQ